MFQETFLEERSGMASRRKKGSRAEEGTRREQMSSDLVGD